MPRTELDLPIAGRTLRNRNRRNRSLRRRRPLAYGIVNDLPTNARSCCAKNGRHTILIYVPRIPLPAFVFHGNVPLPAYAHPFPNGPKRIPGAGSERLDGSLPPADTLGGVQTTSGILHTRMIGNKRRNR